MKYDKQITRWAAQGVDKVLMFGRWWKLKLGRTYRVDWKRRLVQEVSS